MTSRESVYQALFDLTLPLFPSTLKSRSRVAINWDKSEPEEQPSLYQIQNSESALTLKGTPNVYTLTCEWYVYVNATNDPNALHSTPINDIFDALEAVLLPSGGKDSQDLGGLVSRVYVGTREIHEGLLGHQVIGILPINIVFLPN